VTEPDDEFEETVAVAFEERFGADPETAAAAAGAAAAFRDEVDGQLTVETVLGAVADADDYEAFPHRYDLAIGELSATHEDCTDSRPYRLAGFDDMAADPDIGT
jgi:hypothetical protein